MLRYLLVDLVTGRVLTEVAPANPALTSWTRGTVTPGRMTLTVSLVGLTPARVARVDEASTPRRTCVYVIRGDGPGRQVAWSGIVWGRKRSSGSATMTLDCAELISYFDHIYITDDLVFPQIDQAAIARTLVGYAQRKAGGNIGVIAADPGYASGVLRDRVYEGTAGKTIRAALEELAGVIGGPESRIEVVATAGGFVRRMLVGTPTLGRPISLTKYVIDEDEA